MSEAGLAQARRTVKEDVVERFAAASGSGYGNLEVFFGIVLPDEVGQRTRSEAIIQGSVLNIGFSGYDTRYDFTSPVKIALYKLIAVTGTFTLPQGKRYFHH